MYLLHFTFASRTGGKIGCHAPHGSVLSSTIISRLSQYSGRDDSCGEPKHELPPELGTWSKARASRPAGMARHLPAVPRQRTVHFSTDRRHQFVCTELGRPRGALISRPAPVVIRLLSVAGVG